VATGKVRMLVSRENAFKVDALLVSWLK
jgi:hypothetical protein